MELNNKDFIILKDFMYNNYGINLENKKTLIETRLLLTIKKLGFNDFKSYIDKLLQDKTGEYTSVAVEKLTTNFTYFMREDMHFDFLKEEVILKALKKPPIGGLKIWSAASSTGEEPYGIAMLNESILGKNPRVRVSLVASDISKNVLNQAKLGIYSKDKVGKLPGDWVNNYFIRKDEKNYELCESIKRSVEFKYFNLNSNLGWENNKYDVVFCRNVMIYFDNPTKQRVIKRIYDSIKVGGYLIIGMSENLSNLSSEFKRVKPSIYRK